MNKKNVNS